MAVKTDTELTAENAVIAANTAAGSNSKTVISQMFQDMIDSKVNSADVPFASVLQTKVTLSSSEILNLYTTRKLAIPAAGAGTVIMPLRVMLVKHYGTTAYNTNSNLELGNGTVFASTFTNALSFNADQISIYNLTGNSQSTISASVNQNIYLDAQTGNPSGGDGTVDVYIVYTVITL